MAFGREPEKIEEICPECGKLNEILWFPKDFKVRTVTGTTGKSGIALSSKKEERVQGQCSCGYKFKTEDLD